MGSKADAYRNTVRHNAEAQARQRAQFMQLVALLERHLSPAVFAAIQRDRAVIASEACRQQMLDTAIAMCRGDPDAPSTQKLERTAGQIQQEAARLLAAPESEAALDEVRAAVSEIAQHMVANWIAITDRGDHRRGNRATEPVISPLASGVNEEKLLAGTEGFGVNTDLLVAAFQSFLNEILPHE